MTEFDSLQISLNITKFRQSANLSQKQLAKMIDLSSNTLSQYERNAKVPSINALEKISTALNITVDHLLSENISMGITGNSLSELRAYLLKIGKEDKEKINNILNSLIENYYKP